MFKPVNVATPLVVAVVRVPVALKVPPFRSVNVTDAFPKTLLNWSAILKIGRAHVLLQSPCNLVCRLLLEKKKKTHATTLQPAKTTQPESRRLGQPQPR